MKPRLLDLFSGAGGAARGYQQAGFHVVGVDNRPQPRYAGDEFIEADALELLQAAVDGGWQWDPGWLDQFDAIHASPPCQAFTDLIEPVRDLLDVTDQPWVIENVAGAPLHSPVMLCGSMCDPPLDVQRHRFFETNWSLEPPTWPCRHDLWTPRFPGATNRRRLSRRTVEVGVWRIPLDVQQRAMGIDWMTLAELSEAIPPAYTELIGHQLRQHIAAVSAGANRSEAERTEA